MPAVSLCSSSRLRSSPPTSIQTPPTNSLLFFCFFLSLIFSFPACFLAVMHRLSLARFTFYCTLMLVVIMRIWLLNKIHIPQHPMPCLTLQQCKGLFIFLKKKKIANNKCFSCCKKYIFSKTNRYAKQTNTYLSFTWLRCPRLITFCLIDAKLAPGCSLIICHVWPSKTIISQLR